MRRITSPLVLACVSVLLAAATTQAQAPAPTPTPGPLQQTIEQIPWWLWVLLTALAFILGTAAKPALTRLGGTLAKALGRLGSGWGFKKRYLTHLVEEYSGLNIRGLKTRAPVIPIPSRTRKLGEQAAI